MEDIKLNKEWFTKLFEIIDLSPMEFLTWMNNAFISANLYPCIDTGVNFSLYNTQVIYKGKTYSLDVYAAQRGPTPLYILELWKVLFLEEDAYNLCKDQFKAFYNITPEEDET